MNGTERSDADKNQRSAITEAEAACIAAEDRIEEKLPTMGMMKEMVTAPQRAEGSAPEDRCDSAERRESAAALPCDLQGHLGAQLRALYGALVKEPVPDKFFHLLKELEAKEREGKS